MEHVDRAASRVSTGAMVGAISGMAYGMYKGLPLGPTTFKVGTSFAIVGTALFVPERLAYMAFENQMENKRRLILTSHAFAGLCGGALNGYLFQKKPLRGMFHFLPVMMAIGYAEIQWEEMKRQKIRSMEETDQINNNTDNASL